MGSDRQLKILVVDDEEGIRRSLRRLLDQLDVEVMTAGGGQEALDMLERSGAALIISDQRMPGMSGVDFLAKSRELAPGAIRILLTGYADIEVTVESINSGAVKYYLYKPWDNDFLLSRVQESLELYRTGEENKRLQELTKQQNLDLKKYNASLKQQVDDRTKEIRAQHEALKKSYMETIRAFSSIMEMRSKEVGSHAQRVAKLVKRMLEGHGLGPKEFQDTVVAAWLHDIGLIGIPDKLFDRDRSELSVKELEIYETHAVLGQSSLLGISGFEEITTIIRHHHENFDGSGYPDQLREKRIPFGARVIRIVDAFDNRAFKNGYPNEKVLNEAAAELVQFSGSYFDPELVKQFIERDYVRDMVHNETAATITIQPSEMQEGMIVAADISTKHGLFLLPKGAKLSRGMINRINKIHGADPVLRGIQVYKQEQTQPGSGALVSR